MTLLSFGKVRKYWEEWNLRGAVLASLFLQIFLILFASSRKRTGSNLLTISIWLAYLLADWVAAFAVGIISNGPGENCPNSKGVNMDLAAFWAPFLLIHLGGPDNITAFSLEDNQLWIRHLFGLVMQFLAVAYVFTQSAPNDFWIPTVLLMIAGLIKYAERNRALYLACLRNFKKSLLPEPDAGPNYAQLMKEYSSMHEANVPVDIEKVTETKNSSTPADEKEEDVRNDLDNFDNAYDFYKIFRGLIADHMFSFQDRNRSRNFFLKRKFKDAFRVMEIELNFMYDELYTKSAMIHSKKWFLVRIFCTVLLAVSFERFAQYHGSIHRFDLAVSYTLLIGAVILDFAGHLKVIFSDWTIVWLKSPKLKLLVSKIHEKVPFGKRSRWSNRISQHSFIYCSLKEKPKILMKAAKSIGIDDLLYNMWYKRRDLLTDSLTDFMFKEIKNKAKQAESIKTAKEIYSARGERALYDYIDKYPHLSNHTSVSEEVEYDESVLLWHIATELCYYTDDNNNRKDENNRKKMCKWISDYMLYLLIMEPTLMSAVAGIVQIRFQDTCAEAEKFFQREQTKSKITILFELWAFFKRCSGFVCSKTKLCCQSEQSGSPSEHDKKDACKKLLEVNTVVKPAEVKGDRSKSVLFDACMLAKDLEKLNEKKWEIMSKVWVELLCYAASHCRSSSHAAQLSKGGELITFVWLLMAHFGLGEQFRIEAGHVRSKLIVNK